MKLLSTFRITGAVMLLLAISVFAAPPKTGAEAGVIVTNIVRKMGGKLERYEQPKVTHSEKKGEWWFFYTLKPPGMPGGHFTVMVDADGKATYRGGK